MHCSLIVHLQEVPRAVDDRQYLFKIVVERRCHNKSLVIGSESRDVEVSHVLKLSLHGLIPFKPFNFDSMVCMKVKSLATFRCYY